MNANNAHWSPDGSRMIAFNSHNPPGPGASVNLYTVRPDGSGMAQVTHYVGGKLNALMGSWSPDGKQIVFDLHGADLDGPGVNQLFVIDADGGPPTSSRTCLMERTPVTRAGAPVDLIRVPGDFRRRSRRRPCDPPARRSTASFSYSKLARGRFRPGLARTSSYARPIRQESADLGKGSITEPRLCAERVAVGDRPPHPTSVR
jgi:hypothetical protein